MVLGTSRTERIVNTMGTPRPGRILLAPGRGVFQE